MVKKEIHEKEILKVIKDNNLFVIQDIFAFYSGIKSSQFYNLELEKSESIKKAIDNNKVKTCQSLKNKWYQSDNSTLQIALFKTICTDGDRRALSQVYQDHTSSDGSMTQEPTINVYNESGKKMNLGKYKDDKNKNTI